jgi:hypothetical protein
MRASRESMLVAMLHPFETAAPAGWPQGLWLQFIRPLYEVLRPPRCRQSSFVLIVTQACRFIFQGVDNPAPAARKFAASRTVALPVSRSSI